MTKKYVRKIIIIGTDLQKIGKTRGVFWMKCVNAFIQRIETTDVDSEERWGGGIEFQLTERIRNEKSLQTAHTTFCFDVQLLRFAVQKYTKQKL